MIISFPFNGSGWFGTDIINNSIDAFDFIDDPRRGFAKEFMRERVVIRCHAIGGDDRTRVKQLWNRAVHTYDSTPSIAPSSIVCFEVLHRRPDQGSSQNLWVEDTLNWRHGFHTEDQPPP